MTERMDGRVDRARHDFTTPTPTPTRSLRAIITYDFAYLHSSILKIVVAVA